MMNYVPGKVVNIDYQYLFGNAALYKEGTNVYTGSLPAKDGTEGIFRNDFRYRARLTFTEDDNGITFFVNADWFFGPWSFDVTEPDKITTKVFEGSEEGAAQAVAYLQQIYDEA